MTWARADGIETARPLDLGSCTRDAALVTVEERHVKANAGPDLESFIAAAVGIEDADEREHAGTLPSRPRRRGFDGELRGADIRP